jgi:hypothetical protein
MIQDERKILNPQHEIRNKLKAQISIFKTHLQSPFSLAGEVYPPLAAPKATRG